MILFDKCTMDTMRHIWRTILAWLQLDPTAVCEMSRGLSAIDYHDYPDDIIGEPAHFVLLTCKRCGKRFTI